jgi:hypothetical protein
MDRAHGSEPTWTKSIPNWAVCEWFYVFFVVNAFVLALLVVSALYMMVSSNARRFSAFDMFKIVLNMLVSGTTTLFFYLICDRSLKPV